jgi:very-short-patch-repair endonuclease
MLKNLPEPLVNTKFHGIEIDFRWPQAKLAVEIDGPQHQRPRTQHDDAKKRAVLEAAGYTLLRFGDHELERAAADIQRHLIDRPNPNCLGSP